MKVTKTNRIYLILSIFSAIVSIIGIGYIVLHNHPSNCVYVVIPMLFGLIFGLLFELEEGR